VIEPVPPRSGAAGRSLVHPCSSVYQNCSQSVNYRVLFFRTRIDRPAAALDFRRRAMINLRPKLSSSRQRSGSSSATARSNATSSARDTARRRLIEGSGPYSTPLTCSSVQVRSGCNSSDFAHGPQHRRRNHTRDRRVVNRTTAYGAL